MYGIQLDGRLRNLWFPNPHRATAYETSFIVVGPVPNDNPGHLTTGLANTSGVAYGLIIESVDSISRGGPDNFSQPLILVYV